MLALDLEHAEGGVPNGGSSAFQQMELVEQQVRPTPHYWCLKADYSDLPAMALAGQLHSIALYRYRVD
jgi:hypothetical protein